MSCFPLSSQKLKVQVLIHRWLWKDAQAWSIIREVLYVFKGHLSSFKVTQAEKFDDIDSNHDDIIKWKHFPRYWPFVWRIHRSAVYSPYKGQWCVALIFSLIYAWILGWVNNHEASDLRCHCAHYDIIVIIIPFWTVTPVLIHRWLWNNAQILKWHKRHGVLFIKVIHQISRSHGLRNWWFWPKLNIKIMHKSWSLIQ